MPGVGGEREEVTMHRIDVSTLANQDISTALLAHTYTADAERELFVRLFADQVAGNGDYVGYVTIQRLGAGSFYRVIPITTAAAAAGVTAIAMTTIGFPVNNTDVVRVYLTGLAGDTLTPDIITEIWEDDYAVAGDAMDLVANAVDAAAIATDAIDADALAASAVAEIADGVWDELLAGHAIAGSAGAALALLGTGTVTIVVPVAATGEVTVYEADDYFDADSRSLEWTDTTGAWPTLTGASIMFYVRAPDGQKFNKAGTVIVGVGPNKQVRVELTNADTAILQTFPSPSQYRVRATLLSGHVVTLVDSTIIIAYDIS